MDQQQLITLLRKALRTQKLKDKQQFHTAVYEATFYLVYAMSKNRLPAQADDITQGVYANKLLKIPLNRYLEILESGKDGLGKYTAITVRNYINTKIRQLVRKKIEEPLNPHQTYQHLSTTLKNIEQHMDLHNAIKKLPNRQASAFVAFYVDGYTYKEIAKLLGTTIGAAKQLTARARKNLRNWL